MISIKEIVSKKGNYAFLCKDHTHFKMCVKQASDEGVVFSKSPNGQLSFAGGISSEQPFIEDYDYIMSNFTKHLSSNNVCDLMKNNGYEIQFYSRDIGNSYGFDWSEWEIIDYTSLIRNNKLNELGI